MGNVKWGGGTLPRLNFCRHKNLSGHWLAVLKAFKTSLCHSSPLRNVRKHISLRHKRKSPRRAFSFVPERGLEPPPLTRRDFESRASTIPPLRLGSVTQKQSSLHTIRSGAKINQTCFVAPVFSFMNFIDFITLDLRIALYFRL